MTKPRKAAIRMDDELRYLGDGQRITSPGRCGIAADISVVAGDSLCRVTELVARLLPSDLSRLCSKP